jgi:hypothetical protein
MFVPGSGVSESQALTFAADGVFGWLDVSSSGIDWRKNGSSVVNTVLAANLETKELGIQQ